MAAFPQCDAPDIIPGYTCAECIGAGGYGEVWKVNAPGGLTKALKIIYGFIGEERADRERKALDRIKNLRHPYLLSLERVEVVDHRLLIVTELADASLMDRFADFGLVKDLVDQAHSLVSGLTPVYAAPETFHGTASQWSDQYSLAVVYQQPWNHR